MNWLVKTEPEDYAAADLAREGRTRWTGVRNPAARKSLAAMQVGEAVLIYHTGGERAIVALAQVAAAAPDSAEPELAFERWLRGPLMLATIKADAAFRDFALVRQGRLSVMPVSPAHWKRLLALEPKTESKPKAELKPKTKPKPKQKPKSQPKPKSPAKAKRS